MFLYFKNSILDILKNINGCTIIELTNYINYNISFKDRLNKGFIGNLIESYINFFVNKKNICDINVMNLEIKTFTLDYNLNLNNDISLMVINNFIFLNSIIISKFFYKIKNILFVIVLNNYENILENNIIINSFILKFNKKDLLKFFNELKIFNNFILNKNYYLNCNNFNTKSFRYQLVYINNDIKKLIIYLKKKIIIKIIKNFNIFN